MAVTLKMIAKEAGVSIMAVSGVLNNRGNSKVSAATRARIQEIARKLDYQPDYFASATRTGIVKTIGVITSGEDHSSMKISSEVLCGIQSKCSELGYNVHLFDTNDLSATFGKIVSHRINKLILVSVNEKIRKEVAELCRKKSLSLVFANGPAAWGFPGAVHNNFQAMYESIKYLIDQGHRKIGLLCSPHHIYINEQRHLGYEKALQEAGITPESSWCSCNCFPDEKGVNCLIRKVKKGELTAIGTISACWAADLQRAAVKEGIKIPEELSIVTMGTFTEALLPFVPCSYSTYDPMEIGTECVSLLFRRETSCDGEEENTSFIEGCFTPMASTAPPPRENKFFPTDKKTKRSTK